MLFVCHHHHHHHLSGVESSRPIDTICIGFSGGSIAAICLPARRQAVAS
jgi:hypothetical protein